MVDSSSMVSLESHVEIISFTLDISSGCSSILLFDLDEKLYSLSTLFICIYLSSFPLFLYFSFSFLFPLFLYLPFIL